LKEAEFVNEHIAGGRSVKSSCYLPVDSGLTIVEWYIGAVQAGSPPR